MIIILGRDNTTTIHFYTQVCSCPIPQPEFRRTLRTRRGAVLFLFLGLLLWLWIVLFMEKSGGKGLTKDERLAA